jgi:hypothetical protein
VKRIVAGLQRSFGILSIAVVMCLVGGRAAAVPLASFDCITNNDAGDCTIGETQLSASLVASGSNALLTIRMTNTDIDKAVVQRVFVDSSIVSAISFSASGGIGQVTFSADSSPGVLPGGSGFVTAASASASNPKPRHGIGYHNQDQNPGQFGEFLLTLSGGDFDALVADLSVGVHVIGFDSDGSEAYVSQPTPEPSTAVLVALGLVGLQARSLRPRPRAR